MAEKKKKSKWKRRIKKALKLAALGTLGYGAAKMFGGKKKFGTDAGFLKSGAAGRASLSTPPIGGTGHISPSTEWIKKKTPVDNVVDSTYDTRFSKPSQELISKAARSQALQAAANAPKGIYPPGMIPTPRTGQGPRRFNTLSKGGRIGAKKGGRVTGIAKRGFGRALMKGKK